VYSLTCRLNSTRAYYEASTKTKIQHRNFTNKQNQNTKQIKQEKCAAGKS
jgi:hypothetical protein